MKLWTCSMRDCTKGEDILLGIFSERVKASNQAQVWLTGVTGGDFTLIDYDNEYDFYRDSVGNHYTAHIEEFTLDELSF